MSKYVIKIYADDRERFYVGEVGHDGEKLDIHNRYSSALADMLYGSKRLRRCFFGNKIANAGQICAQSGAFA